LHVAVLPSSFLSKKFHIAEHKCVLFDLFSISLKTDGEFLVSEKNIIKIEKQITKPHLRPTDEFMGKNIKNET
jgi:hypothetical protein